MKSSEAVRYLASDTSFLAMKTTLQNTVALVTGASSGIGEAKQSTAPVHAREECGYLLDIKVFRGAVFVTVTNHRPSWVARTA
jgi:hypothetical protein